LAASFIGVAIAISAIILLLGTAVVWLSFTSGVPGDPDSALTVGNYLDVGGSAFTYQVLLNTLAFSTIALVVALGFGLPLAWLAERTDMPGKSIIFTLMTISLIIPNFAVALGWVFLFNPQIGIINAVLVGLFGLQRPPFDIASLSGMGLVEGLNLAPVAFVMTAAALKSMDPSLEEAAAMAEATTFNILRRVTFPALAPAILGAAIYIFTLGFAAFDVPAVIGLSRRIFTFSTYVYNLLDQAVDVPQYGAVGALSVGLIAFGVGLGWYYNRVQGQSRRFATISGKAFRPRIQQLERARLPAVLFAATYFVAAQLLPLLVLGWAALLPFLQLPSARSVAQLSFANFSRVTDLRFLDALGNTFSLMLLVPTATVAVSVAVSWVIVRSRLRFRTVFDFIVFLPHTVPTVVFSIAALFVALFVLQPVIPIYGTIWLLVAVYTIARLSYGTRMTNAALVQIHGELEEAAETGGASAFATLRAVVLPLMRPTLLYSWIWIALLSYRELTLPVLLSTQSNLPLSVLVWGYLQTSEYGPASAITLVMLALLSPMVVVYWLAARRAGITAGSTRSRRA
jgi:iron(III) transport system permease protein